MERSLYQRIVTRQGPAEFLDIGTGFPILYFHGSGAGAEVAPLLEQPLIDDGFRLIVPNRPGYFGTPLESGRTSTDCTELAVGILDHLKIDRAAVIGMSSGGMAAATFANLHSHRTATLVFQCALSHPISSTRWMPSRFQWAFPLMRNPRFGLPLFRLAYQIEAKWIRWNPKHLIAHTAGPRTAEVLTDECLQALLPKLVQSATDCAKQPAGVENDYALLFGEPWLQPGSVHCPTLILHDLADPVARLPHVEWAMNCIPHAELCDLHAGGHLIWFGHDAARMQRRRAAFICKFAV